jgi:hypothetical protein
MYCTLGSNDKRNKDKSIRPTPYSGNVLLTTLNKYCRRKFEGANFNNCEHSRSHLDNKAGNILSKTPHVGRRNSICGPVMCLGKNSIMREIYPSSTVDYYASYFELY